MSRKIAVVLFNLGGPDSQKAIKPFLMNFFMDLNIISLPFLPRYILASFIAWRRSKKEAGESYAALGGASPLLKNTKLQAEALESILNEGAGKAEFKLFVSMRYWHPMSAKIVQEIQDWGADQMMILPLYPQFSTTTTGSSLQDWKASLLQGGLEALPMSMVCCYPKNGGFIAASVAHIRERYAEALSNGHQAPRLLFSAHGLPENIIKKGDPYQWQCEETAQKIAEELNIADLDWQLCYQSRVGRLKWIGPSLDEALQRAATDQKAVVIYPHAFTQEHVETLVELDIEYKELAESLGIKGYYRAQTVGTHPEFIEGLAGLVQRHINQEGILAENFVRSCPQHFERCCMQVVQ